MKYRTLALKLPQKKVRVLQFEAIGQPGQQNTVLLCVFGKRRVRKPAS